MSSEPGPSQDKIWTREFLLIWIATWLIFLGFYLLLPTLPGYLLSIGGKPSQVGWLIGLLTVPAMICRPIGGRLADVRGKPWTMLFGSSLLTVTLLFYLLVKTPAALLTLRFFHGIGWAIYLTAAVALISDLAHPARRATVTGHYFLANTLALIVGPWLGILLRRNFGYPVLFATSIGLTGAAVMATWPLHRSISHQRPASLPRWISPAAWLPSATVVFASFTYGGVISFLPLYAERNPPNHIGMFFAVYALTLGLSRPAGGYLSDHFGRRIVILPCLLLLAFSMAGLAWLSPARGFIMIAIVYGIASGGIGSALSALTIDRVPARERGAAMGMFTAAFESGLSLGAVVLGFVLAHGDFTRVWLTAGIVPLFGFVFFLIAGRN